MSTPNQPAAASSSRGSSHHRPNTGKWIPPVTGTLQWHITAMTPPTARDVQPALKPSNWDMPLFRSARWMLPHHQISPMLATMPSLLVAMPCAREASAYSLRKLPIMLSSSRPLEASRGALHAPAALIRPLLAPAAGAATQHDSFYTGALSLRARRPMITHNRGSYRLGALSALPSAAAWTAVWTSCPHTKLAAAPGAALAHSTAHT